MSRFTYCYDECCYSEYWYAESRYAECQYAECRDANKDEETLMKIFIHFI